jgi:hypothetical protein
MKSFELLLTGLFIIIIYMVFMRKIESDVVICMASLWLVIFYFGCDYNHIIDRTLEWCGIKSNSLRRRDIKKKTNKQRKCIKIDKVIKKLGSDPDKRNDIEKKVDAYRNNTNDIYEPREESDAFKLDNYKNDSELHVDQLHKEGGLSDSNDDSDLKPISSRPVPLEYSENNYKNNIFDEIGCIGDNKFAHHMKHVSNKNRVAMDNMARQNKYTNLNYFANELKDHANSVWWDDETLEQEF